MSSRWSCERKSGERAPARVTPRGAPSRSRSRGSTWVSSTSAAGTCRAVSAAPPPRSGRPGCPRSRPGAVFPVRGLTAALVFVVASWPISPLSRQLSGSPPPQALPATRCSSLRGTRSRAWTSRTVCAVTARVVNGRLATVCGTVERVNKLVASAMRGGTSRDGRRRPRPHHRDRGQALEAGHRLEVDAILPLGAAPWRRPADAANTASSTCATSTPRRISSPRARASTPTAPWLRARASSTAGSIAGSSCACPRPSSSASRGAPPASRREENHPRGAAARVQRVRLGGRAGRRGFVGEDAGTDATTSEAVPGGSGAAVGPVDATTREAMCARRPRRGRRRVFWPSPGGGEDVARLRGVGGAPRMARGGVPGEDAREETERRVARGGRGDRRGGHRDRRRAPPSLHRSAEICAMYNRHRPVVAAAPRRARSQHSRFSTVVSTLYPPRDSRRGCASPRARARSPRRS